MSSRVCQFFPPTLVEHTQDSRVLKMSCSSASHPTRGPPYAKCAVCGSTVNLEVRREGDKTAVTFYAGRNLGWLEKSAMGTEWIGQTEAPERQVGTLSVG